MESASTKTLGQRIKARRKQLGMSASALARRAGVTRDTLHAWETGQSEPRANKLLMLAGVLGTNVGWLMEGSERCGPAPQATSDVAALRDQLGQARELADNLANMLNVLQSRINAIEQEDGKG